MALRLSSDHRIVYGAQAAGFAARVAGLLEEPGALA
jgi:pyruvate/2-oxoglutarate dehydrogenase complex dihydrolipoamide acyltransferase (E2) component